MAADLAACAVAPSTASTVGISEEHSQREGIIRPGDVVAGLKAVRSAHEVRQMRQRLNDSLDDRAARGVAPGSKPFGYDHAVTEGGDKTYVEVPARAEAIRFAAARVLAGWSLANVAATLREQGLTGAHGGTIRPGAVRSMVTRPWPDSAGRGTAPRTDPGWPRPLC